MGPSQLRTSIIIPQSLQIDNLVALSTTIVYQLPTYFPLMDLSWKRRYGVTIRSFGSHCQKVASVPRRRLIIINGLDENPNVQARLKILQTILESVGGLPFVRLNLSRPGKILGNGIGRDTLSPVKLRWEIGWTGSSLCLFLKSRRTFSD